MTFRIVEPMDEYQRRAIVYSARRYLGIPFRHQGRTKKGLDCIGLLVRAMRDCGYLLADRTDYGRLPADRKLIESLTDHFGPPVRFSSVSDLSPGEIVAMSWGAEAGHIGLITDHPEGIGIIHSYALAGRVIEHSFSDFHLRRVVARFIP